MTTKEIIATTTLTLDSGDILLATNPGQEPFPCCIRCSVPIALDELAAIATRIVSSEVYQHGVTIAVTCPTCTPVIAVFDPAPHQKEVSYEPTH